MWGDEWLGWFVARVESPLDGRPKNIERRNVNLLLYALMFATSCRGHIVSLSRCRIVYSLITDCRVWIFVKGIRVWMCWKLTGCDDVTRFSVCASHQRSSAAATDMSWWGAGIKVSSRCQDGDELTTGDATLSTALVWAPSGVRREKCVLKWIILFRTIEWNDVGYWIMKLVSFIRLIVSKLNRVHIIKEELVNW